MAPRKEVAHCACLMPWPVRGDDEAPYIILDATMLREEAVKFGTEVIDVWWIRAVLKACADYMQEEEETDSRLAGQTCLGCGLTMKHFKNCPTLVDKAAV